MNSKLSDKSEPTEPPPRISAERLIGGEAFDPDDRPVGRIADIMIEPRRGTIAFVVLNYRDEDGNEKRFAIPVHACKFKTDSVVVRVDPQTLSHSPGRW